MKPKKRHFVAQISQILLTFRLLGRKPDAAIVRLVDVLRPEVDGVRDDRRHQRDEDGNAEPCQECSHAHLPVRRDLALYGCSMPARQCSTAPSRA